MKKNAAVVNNAATEQHRTQQSNNFDHREGKEN